MGGRLYALLVGIDAYPSPVPALHGCVNDIEQVAELLNQLPNGGVEQVELKLLRNEEATRAAVVEAFRTHLGRARKGDAALFYYCGHGSQEEAPLEFLHIEPDGLDETLVCYDSRDEGKWDLADKEIARLIEEVSRPGPHILCVLDCCHSGSGTRAALDSGTGVRRAPTDRRHRPIESFIDGVFDSTKGARIGKSNLGWADVPLGKHILFAACRSSETAKEVLENGKKHGAFTASLLTTLRQTRGQITYRDLLKRCEAQVRLRVEQQVPQLECSDVTELKKRFLASDIAPDQFHLTLRYDRGLGWVIDGGAIHGIAPPVDRQQTILAIFDIDQRRTNKRQAADSLGFADVEVVRPELSQVHVRPTKGALDQKLTYHAVVVATTLPAITVHLEGSSIGVRLVRDALTRSGDDNSPSLLVREVGIVEDAKLRLSVDDRFIRISAALGVTPLVAEIEGVNELAAQIAVDRLEHVARWHALATLKNPRNRLKADDVEIAVRILRNEGTLAEAWVDVDPRTGIHLEYRRVGSKWVAPQVRIDIRNRSEIDCYCALLWLGEDYSISSKLFPAGVEHLPAKGQVTANNGRSIYPTVPTDQWQRGRTEASDIVKLIISTTQFDARLFDQPALDGYVKATRGFGKRPQSTLERLARRIHERALSLEPEAHEDILDWATAEISIGILRPLDTVDVPSGAQKTKLCAGVAILGHPTLRAKARLASRGEASRALEGLDVPTIFRDDPEGSQPFYFQTARGTDGGLGALELFDIENPEAVTPTSPLLLKVDAGLADREHVLPFAWDGEFFLPLGATIRRGGDIQIELRQLPSSVQTQRDVERGVGRSIRILFQKVLSEKLGLGFDYPHLAAVDFLENGEPHYETDVERVRLGVAAAKRIVLYIHGILGDTTGMVRASQVFHRDPTIGHQGVGKLYDLVLAFDYENLNTGIRETAAALEQRLSSVGLLPGCDKVLHIIAHSMGGLVSRWYIERLGGNEVVQQLVTLGTPHAGSPWPTVQDWAISALGLAINRLTDIAWPLKVVGSLVEAVEKADVMLDEMGPGSTLLTELASSPDPHIRYDVLIGNTSIIQRPVSQSRVDRLLQRLAPQRLLHTTTALAFLGAPNDIAVSVTSAASVPLDRNPAPEYRQVACDHVSFFTSNAGQLALLRTLVHNGHTD